MTDDNDNGISVDTPDSNDDDDDDEQSEEYYYDIDFKRDANAAYSRMKEWTRTIYAGVRDGAGFMAKIAQVALYILAFFAGCIIAYLAYLLIADAGSKATKRAYNGVNNYISPPDSGASDEEDSGRWYIFYTPDEVNSKSLTSRVRNVHETDADSAREEIFAEMDENLQQSGGDNR